MNSQSLKRLQALWIWARSRHGGGGVEGFSPLHLWEELLVTQEKREGKQPPPPPTVPSGEPAEGRVLSCVSGSEGEC